MDRVTGYRTLLALLAISSVTFGLTADALVTQSGDPPAEDAFAVEMDAAADGADQGGDDGSDEEAAAAPAAERTDSPAEDVATTPADAGLLPHPRFILAAVSVLLAAGVVTTLAGGLVISEGVRTGLLLALAGPLLAKRHRGEAATLSRGRILGFVEAHPGIHFSALRDALGLANGVTSHHLQRLEREGRVISWADGTKRRYAASGIDRDTIARLEHPVSGMQRAILETLATSGALGTTAADLRKRLEASRQLVAYHLGQLDQRDLVERSGRGRGSRWVLSDDGRTLLEAQAAAAI